ncbi:MAG: ExbD/TolR family protein [Planctomycetota bacterium]|jgi:biopolymer transport protein ExbD
MAMTQSKQSSGFHQAVMGSLSRRRNSVGLRMTPMIDVIFLLLTFFVLTAKFQEPEQLLPVFVGNSETQTIQNHQKPLVIHIKPVPSGCQLKIADREPIILLNADPQNGLLVLAQNVQIISESAPISAIELFYDDQITWDMVVKVYDVLYSIGARDITFRIEE